MKVKPVLTTFCPLFRVECLSVELADARERLEEAKVYSRIEGIRLGQSQ